MERVKGRAQGNGEPLNQRASVLLLLRLGIVIYASSGEKTSECIFRLTEPRSSSSFRFLLVIRLFRRFSRGWEGGKEGRKEGSQWRNERRHRCRLRRWRRRPRRRRRGGRNAIIRKLLDRFSRKSNSPTGEEDQRRRPPTLPPLRRQRRGD